MLWLTTKEVELRTYQRVVLLLQREEQEEKHRWFAPYLPWNSELPYLPWNSEPSLCRAIKPGKMYFRIFKDIEVSDIDMLIPGSKVQFTRLDFTLLVIPLMVGIISACWKAINGTLRFDTVTHMVTSIVLVILPLIYATRAYTQFCQKRNAYQSSLVRKLSLQTIANNAGRIYLSVFLTSECRFQAH